MREWVAALGAVLAVLSAARAATPATTLRVASGLSRPLFVTHVPGDVQRIFIVEQAGKIRILRNGRLLARPFLDVDPISLSTLERGLLGLAFHPDYVVNGQFFIYYVNNSGNNAIARYSVSRDPDVADPAGTPVLTINHPFFDNHYGGWIGFGPDGYLYIAVGDGGWRLTSDPDPENNAQDITGNLLGKVLRLDVNADDFPADANRNYAIPPNNPFVGIDGDDEIWAYGLRNPWRCAFDAGTGDFYITDVGHRDWEEINVESAGSSGGRNYGWKCTEGTHCTIFGGCACPSPELTPPIHEYGHTGTPLACSITGGEVYRGCAIPELLGVYFYSDYCSHEIWSFRYQGNVAELQNRTADLAPPNNLDIRWISSFGTDASGELYLCDHQGGEVFKIIPAAPISIAAADPPDGAIDARRPFSPEDGVPVGWQEILLAFNGPVECVTPLDFKVTQQGVAGEPPFVTDVQPTHADEVRLLLNRPITVLAWTTIDHLSSGTGVRIGFLPGDVGGDGVSDLADLNTLLDALNGVGPARPMGSTDIDHSKATTPADLLEEVDLLVGAGDYDVYEGAVLP